MRASFLSAPADRDFAPSYPGITDSPTMDSWDPPFPVDLKKIRPRDEVYWERYRTAPKAFIPLDVGQRLWGSRHGALTSIRLAALPGRDLDETVRAFDERLRSKIDPVAFGATVADVRNPALAASQGATDFGEYFLYFSFFLVVAALVLASLFFRLGVEQRAREVGLLRAVGVDAPTVRWLLTTEAVLLSAVGTILGLAGAIGYAWLVIKALTTWWVDAVGTTALTVHVAPVSLGVGAVSGIAAAVLCTWWTLRGLSGISERSLLAGDLPAGGAMPGASGARTTMRAAAVLAAAARWRIRGPRECPCHSGGRRLLRRRRRAPHRGSLRVRVLLPGLANPWTYSRARLVGGVQARSAQYEVPARPERPLRLGSSHRRRSS